MATKRQREEAQTAGFRKASRMFLKQGGYRESEGHWRQDFLLDSTIMSSVGLASSQPTG